MLHPAPKIHILIQLVCFVSIVLSVLLFPFALVIACVLLSFALAAFIIDWLYLLTEKDEWKQ